MWSQNFKTAIAIWIISTGYTENHFDPRLIFYLRIKIVASSACEYLTNTHRLVAKNIFKHYIALGAANHITSTHTAYLRTIPTTNNELIKFIRTTLM